MTQQLPRIAPGPTDTAPLWRSEIGKLDSLMSEAPPPPPPPPAFRRGFVLKALGLLGIAFVAGMVWLVISPGNGPTTTSPTTTQPVGEFTFAKSDQVPEPLKDSRCEAHAYGQTKEFLIATPCQQLTRGLYTTTMSDGRTVYTSVSVVRMRSAEDAAKFKELTSKDGTGNVSDLVKDGAVEIPGLKSLASGGFASQLRDREVIIIESDTVQHGPDEAEHNKQMKRVSNDAFRLAADLT